MLDITSKLRLALMCVGLVLMIINAAGLLIPLRGVDVSKETNPLFGKNVTLSPQQLYSLAAIGASDRPAYFTKMATAVHHTILHYWNDEGIERYHLRVPITENFILCSAGFIYPKYFRKYEFANHNRAIARGVGLCSQSACILSDLLEEKSIDTDVIGLSGHVIATAEVDHRAHKWWLLDPDYGVVIPHNIDTVEHSPDLIRPYYAHAGYSKATIDDLVRIYAADGNQVLDNTREYWGDRRWIERTAYALKWLIPIALIALGLIRPKKGVRSID